MPGPGSHRFFSASAAHRWMACPASAVIDTSGIPDRSSAAADRGTLLHAESERQLRALFESAPGFDASHRPCSYIPREGERVRLPLPTPADFTPEDVEMVRSYVDYVATIDGIHLFEFVSEFLPGVGGTADAVIIHLGDSLLEIVDLKTGYHRVDPVSNIQLSIYALGVLTKLDGIFDFERVRITIFQPAVSATAQHWEVPVEFLRSVGDAIRGTVDDIKSGFAPFEPGGDTCRWCKAKPICPALAGKALAAARDQFRNGGADWEASSREFEIIAETAAASDEDPEIAVLAVKAKHLDLVKLWAKTVEEELRATLLNGTDVPGWKVVRGRAGNRGWALSEDETAKALRELGLDPYGPAPLLGPPGIEKMVKGLTLTPERVERIAEKLPELIKKGAPGAPTVVRADDRRPAIEKKELATSDFAAVLAGEEAE